MTAFATFPTSNALRYLSMLCTHFGNQVRAQAEAGEGWIQFPFGRCEMSADDSHLRMQVSASDQTQLDQLVDIVTRHLERFAFRENPILEWQARSD